MVSGRFGIYLDGEPLSPGALARLTELELRQGDDAIGLLRLRFALVQAADGTYPLLDGEAFVPGTEISLSLAAPGGADARVFTGHLAAIRPHFETIEANAYLDVVAHDPAILLDAEERVAAYPDMSDSEAAGEVLARYGILIEGSPTDARADKDDRLLIQRGTDWAFLRLLAERNGFALRFEADPADGRPVCRFGPPRLDDTPQADLTILRENANLLWLDVQIALDRPARRAGAAIDPLAKRLLRTDLPSSAPVMGEGLLAERAEEGLGDRGAGAAVRLLRGAPPGDAALNAFAAGLMASDHLAVEARGELDPGLYRNLLRPHRPVLIKGVGDRLSGSYYVRSVRTLMREGDLTQTFVAVRNALGRTGLEAFGQSAEEVPAT